MSQKNSPPVDFLYLFDIVYSRVIEEILIEGYPISDRLLVGGVRQACKSAYGYLSILENTQKHKECFDVVLSDFINIAIKNAKKWYKKMCKTYFKYD